MSIEVIGSNSSGKDTPRIVSPDDPGGVGLIPISIRIEGDPIVTEKTTLTITVNGPDQTADDALAPKKYDLDYFQIDQVSEDSNGNVTVSLKKLAAPIYPQGAPIYGDSAAAVIEVDPSVLGTMHVIVLATEPNTPINDSELGIGVIPIHLRD